MYEVQVVPLDTSFEAITAHDLEPIVNVTGLDEYVLYNISVRAYTSVGPGPYSTPVTIITHEDGESIKHVAIITGYCWGFFL